MNRTETAAVWSLVAMLYQLPPDPAAIEAWHLVLGDLDPGEARDATVELCRRMPHAPRPADIIAEVARRGGAPPDPATALGHYLAGNWDAHPTIREVAARVTWDRRYPEAERQFRAIYAAKLADDDTGTRRPTRPATGSGPQRLTLPPIGNLPAAPDDRELGR